MRYMKDIIIDLRHLTTKVNLYLIINFHNIYIVYYINLTNLMMRKEQPTSPEHRPRERALKRAGILQGAAEKPQWGTRPITMS